jgi:cell division protein FtsL
MKKYIAIIFVTIISIINADAQSYNKDVIINKIPYTISSKTNPTGELSFELYKTIEPSNKKDSI